MKANFARVDAIVPLFRVCVGEGQEVYMPIGGGQKLRGTASRLCPLWCLFGKSLIEIMVCD